MPDLRVSTMTRIRHTASLKVSNHIPSVPRPDKTVKVNVIHYKLLRAKQSRVDLTPACPYLQG